MRIALFSWESLDAVAVGGVGVHVSELARALARRDHEVHLFTGTTRGDQEHYEHIEGVYVHRCGYDRHDDFLYEMWNMCRAFEHHFFTTRALTGEFDVIHAHDWMTAEVMSLLKGQCPARRILTIHSTEFGRAGNKIHGGPSEAVRHAEWQGIYQAERVVCVSQALKHEVAWLYQAPDDKLCVIYNGVRPELFDLDVDAGEVKVGLGIHPMAPMFLFAGRIVYQKGVDLLVEAMPMLLRHVPTAMFVLAGDGEMRWDLEHKTRATMEHNTRWLGKVEPARLRAYFKACDAVVVPSRNEPFGIVILEAWSARKPVVATKNGGPGEFVEHGVDGYSIYDHPDSIAWGLGQITADWEKTRKMGKNGRRKVEQRFTWDRIAAQVEEVYRGTR
ncbi:MAG: glycosyltransferase family 4 protein [Planctomycetota bacterium]|nr:glycosyltransferase family 4 protein [Planctomycetota bacterium]